jgi:hypothetical protein
VGAVAITLAAAVHAASPQPAVVWFRSSDGCPDGAAFLARLAAVAPRARLAEAGDHVDFVVTLGTTERGSYGRLERQTRSGTVAMRELDDASCSDVADALALSLSLALDREPRAALDAAPPPPQPPEPAAKPAVASKSAPPLGAPEPVDAPRPSRLPWGLGVQGGLITGVAPRALIRLAGFAEVTPLPRASLVLRAAATGALGSSETAIGGVDHWIVAGRLEACPVRIGGRPLGLWPCGAVDLGATGASGTRSATALWSALAAHWRLRWWVSRSFAAETELGALFPLTRCNFASRSAILYRTAPVGLSAALGVGVRFQ